MHTINQMLYSDLVNFNIETKAQLQIWKWLWKVISWFYHVLYSVWKWRVINIRLSIHSIVTYTTKFGGDFDDLERVKNMIWSRSLYQHTSDNSYQKAHLNISWQLSIKCFFCNWIFHFRFKYYNQSSYWYHACLRW